MQLIDYLVLVAYFAIMIGIGLWAMRRVSDQEDYFMGGRGFGKLLQTFAAFGAGTGAHEPVTGRSNGLDQRTERRLVGADVVVRHTDLLDHGGLVSADATPDSR